MSIRATLEAARALIADQEHWVQGSYAVENTGLDAWPHDPEAYAFCSIGAVIKTSGAHIDDAGTLRTTPLFEACVADLSRAAQVLFNTGHVSAINDGEFSDDPAGAHRDALSIFDKAIADAG